MQLLTIISQNYKNLVAEITELLASNHIDIIYIDVHLAGQDAYVNLHVSNYDESLRLLTHAGFNAVSDESVLLKVKDGPGALAMLSRQIADNGIGTRAITMLHQGEGYSVVALSTDDNEVVRQLFAELTIS